MSRRWIVPAVCTALGAVVLLLVVLFPDWFAPGQHLRRYLPIQLGAAGLAFGMLWFGAVGPRYVFPGGLACGLLTCAATSAVLSIRDAADWASWFSSGLTSGRLAYYFASVVFAASMLLTARRLPEPGSAEARTARQNVLFYQWALFATGLALLGLGFALVPDSPYLPLLAWAIFFVVDEWSLLEHFVIFGGQPLPWRHFFVVVAIDLVIAVASVRTALDLLNLNDPTMTWAVLGLFAALAALIVGVAAVLLFRLASTEVKPVS